MMNNVLVVGKLRKIEDTGNGAIITVECTRAFKNAEGIYESDFIDFVVWEGIKNNLIEYCKQGDTIGVRGRIITKIENDVKITELLADKISFLSANPKLKKEED